MSIITIANLMVHCAKLFTCISHLTLQKMRKRTSKCSSLHHLSPGTRRKPARAILCFTVSKMRHKLWEVRCTGRIKGPEPVLKENLEMLFLNAGSTLRWHSLPHSDGPQGWVSDALMSIPRESSKLKHAKHDINMKCGKHIPHEQFYIEFPASLFGNVIRSII